MSTAERLTQSEAADKSRESSLRAQCKRRGYLMRKSRQPLSLDNLGDFMIIDAQHYFVVRGGRYDMSLDDVEAFLNQAED